MSESKIEEINAFRTIDGEIFTDVIEAIRHQNELTAIRYFNNNKLYGEYQGCTIDDETIVEFIKKHSAVIKKLID